ncbi:pyridoxal phosphate-dependent aminotransferase [Albidovulum sediminicola]|uniref:Aminotransferase n=1 Tax=Albidovulum sediminicola TaxID=2984331 RepID=A0ABT2YX97_9RHOB|nr:pyridoxal phosphate-dependent aminotransferase [Defluviimonas sp. WL0075]MCV2863499.1 pyridoxal phosphate-dependent aminotransferase [Defluviimonas sp. WL0075]
MPQDPFRRATRIAAVELSEIIQVSEAAAALKRAGRDVISLGTGEPDFPTPPHVVAAAHEAALRGETTYTPTAGTPALRTAIAAACERENGYRPEPAEVIVSTGAKQVIFNAFFATLDAGDEVILAAPYWTSYPDMVAVCGGTSVVVPTDAATGFKLTPDALAAAITGRTRWVLLNSPGNPSGAVYAPAELEALAEVLRGAPHVGIIADEIYQHICYVPFASFRTVAPDLAGRMLIVNGVSKSYAMTGWRIGWGIGPRRLIEAMAAAQGQATSGASSVGQAAALAAISGDQQLLAERNDDFRDRRDMVQSALNATGLIRCASAEGAFYLFPDCTATFGKTAPDGAVIDCDADFTAALLSAEGVALVPGRAFGLPGHFRLSYAYARASLAEACTRIARFCQSLT